MADTAQLDQSTVSRYDNALDRMVTKAKQKGHRWELLLSMAKAVQSELHADQEVRFASGMELLLRAVIELLEEPLTPSHNYVDNKIDNGVRRIQEEFRTHK